MDFTLPHVSRCLGVIVFSFLFSFSFAQQTPDYEVLYHYGKRALPANFNQLENQFEVQAGEVINGQIYRIVQFYELPNAAERAQIELKGVRFLEYLPHYAYLLSIPEGLDPNALEEFSVRSVVPVTGVEKVAANLVERPFGDWAVKGNKVRIDLQFYKDIPLQYILNQCSREGIIVTKSSENASYLKILIKESRIEEVAKFPFVQFMALVPPPPKKEDTEGRSLHRASAIDSYHPNGRHYTGEGVGVHCRDDGFVGPHIDFQGRIFQFTNDFTGDHGDGVSGIMAGAGNLNPDNRGMAAGSDLYVTNYVADFLDNTLDLHQNEDVKVTNSSYSNGCNAGYTLITQTVDGQMYDYQSYLHVFSAGNSNNLDCDYGAGNQWGNITGGHKQGKNVIATANLFSDASLVNSSSRGPAHDGRIKPDIAANGQNQISTDENNTYLSFGGTSGAAPGIAGISAQLIQAYREHNGGEDPNAGMIKACLLNTANDLGNEGPDFRYGWGHVNALRAVKLIEQNAFLKDEVDQGDANTHQINVPDGAEELRVMVYWTDPPATPMTSKALVNDLNMVMTTPGGTSQLPWILDPSPSPSSLNQPATNGIDDLNNMEQIIIKEPQEGTFEVSIEGFEVPLGAQEYFVVYEIVTDEITLTYPIGGEKFEPFNTERIHWDAFGDTGNFTLEYTLDEGATWNTIATVSGNVRMYNWNVPSTTSGQAKIRVTRGNASDESDANFSIAYVPSNIVINQVCPDYVRIVWPPVFDATGYDIFVLGEKYMDSIGTTNVPLFDIPVQFPLEDFWFAVRAKGENGMVSQRSIAINYNGLLQDCQQPFDLAVTNILNPGDGDAFTSCEVITTEVTITITNEGANTASDFGVGFQLTNQTAVLETYNGSLAPGESVEYTFDAPAQINDVLDYELNSWVTQPSESFVFNDTSSVNFKGIVFADLNDVQELDYIETFGGDFPPNDIVLINPNEDLGWEGRTRIGPQGVDTRVAQMNNNANGNIGSKDYIMTFPVNLVGATNPYLIFDYSYTYYEGQNPSRYDSLFVGLTLDCGLTFEEVLFYDGGESMATVNPQPQYYAPEEPEDWKRIFIPLTDHIGLVPIFQFININGNGNTMYLDNIQVVNLTAPQADFIASETEICEGQNITFVENTTGAAETFEWDFGPSTSPSSASGPGPHTVFFLKDGINDVTLTASNIVGSDIDIQQLNILPKPEASFEISSQGQLTYEFINTTLYGDTYEWDFGDGNMSNEENPTHTYDETGEYQVRLIVNNDCGLDLETEDLMATLTNTRTLSNDKTVKIQPNPSSGYFILTIEGSTIENDAISIVDIQGKVLNQVTIEQVPSTNATFQVNAGSLPAGIYFVKIATRNGLITKKVVIQ